MSSAAQTLLPVDASVPSRLTIQLTSGPCSGTELHAKGYSLTVGRTRSSKLHIKDSSVSEKHALVSWNGSSWVLRDCGSSNGTAINGRKVQPMVETVTLQDGDEVLFGLESKGTIKLEQCTLGELTVEQLLASLCEAGVNRIEARGHENAKQLLTELGQAKAKLQQHLQATKV